MSQLFFLDPDSTLNLQAQIKAALVDAIMARRIPVGERLPSTRQMARQLGVSRNTVIAAVQDLIAEGYLVSRERSGTFVNEEMLTQQLEAPETAGDAEAESEFWRARVAQRVRALPDYPANWSQYPYLFIEGQFDHHLFPIAEWRECARIVQGVREIDAWAADAGGQDDPLLVEQIRTRLLPQRGISASADEILVTHGSQSALALVAQLLMTANTRVAVEDPGYLAAFELFQRQGSELVRVPVDGSGLVINDELRQSDIAYTTPSHQFPTTVTMDMGRKRELLATAEAHDLVIIEDDYAQEANFIAPNSPALKSLDKSGRVIYVSSLSKMLAPGIRIGYMVASAELIRQVRALRRLSYLHVANNNQRMAALFMSLGHYDALTRKLTQVRKERWLELRRAVNYCFPQPEFMITTSTGGTACWIEGPEELDAEDLVDVAQQHGILMDNPRMYLADHHPRNFFRLSVTSIDVEKIRPGLEELARLIKDLLGGVRETLDNTQGRVLSPEEIAEVMPGSALIGKTAYGDAYTVELHADGSMQITYDNQNQDTDTGRWWIEQGMWWRQFSRSTYGEARGFHVALHGDAIKWFDADGDLIDTELFVRNYQAAE